jgi:hypothetical protein
VTMKIQFILLASIMSMIGLSFVHGSDQNPLLQEEKPMASYASQKYKEIVTCDEDKANILQTPSLPLKEDDWALARSTAEKLLFVRNEILKGGAGLAAPQIGLNHPVFLYTPDRTTENLRVVINPSFESVGEECVEGSEACFSASILNCLDAMCISCI